MAGKAEVCMGSSKMKVEIARVLKEEGYVDEYSVDTTESKPVLKVKLRYYQGRPVIDTIKRISKPGLRIFKGKDEMPSVNGGFGVAIISTSKGIMTERSARSAGQGGEVLCTVS
jgi:small subunit ribosomal protein S8